MPITIHDQGQNNRVQIAADLLAAGHGTITLVGDDNEVRIGPGCSATNINLRLANGSRFNVGPACRLAAVEVHTVRNGNVFIGAGTGFTWHSRLYLHEPGTIRIGAGCLIASGTMLTVSDMHSVIDLDTGKRTNPAADVTLKDRIWLGEGVVVMRGVTIGQGSIIGFGSKVTRNIPAHCMAVGYPAKVVRERVDWSHDLDI
jgi:acetyltransferase-like isoleucine patch superfamily enzyme